MKITSVQIDPAKLQRTIATYFSLDEIRTLCLALGIEYEDLPTDTRSGKARGLVEACQRQRQLVTLAEAVLEQRDNIQPHEFLRDIADDDAPFKGLLSFEEADEEIFFGRGELTAELVARVSQPPGGLVADEVSGRNLREVSITNFLAIVGASGSGKSSVVKAGMIPHLRRQTNWPIHLITPTALPLQALATSLTRDSASVRDTANLIDDLKEEPRALRLYAARLLQNSPSKRLLLVVDQFEELFTLCKDEAERTAFVENLVAAVAGDSQITILLTLRADFYHHCLQYQPLHHLLEAQQKIVPTMSSTELRAAIERPAQQANLMFDDGLVDILLRDVGAADNQTPEPGALPLLSHALLETWQRRDPSENRLTLAGYTEAGGVQGAIAKTAESTYQRLPADQQKIARSIFLRLTELGEGTQDTRRRATLTELLPQNDARTTVEQVLKTLADARLLTTSDDGAEVAHEALIRQWPTLQNWLDEDREGIRLHRQLTEEAMAWQAAHKDASYLYRGGRLTQIVEWAKESQSQLNDLEASFLQASKELRKDKLLEANARAEKEARIAQSLRQRAFFLVVTVIVSVMLAIVAFLSFQQASANEEKANQNALNADSQAATAIYNEHLALTREAETEIQRQIAQDQLEVAILSTESQNIFSNQRDPELATLLAIEAANINKQISGEAEWLVDSALRPLLEEYVYFNNSLIGHEGTVNAVVFSPDGRYLASSASGNGGNGQTFRLWDLDSMDSESVLDESFEAPVVSIAFSPDSNALATGSGDGTIRMWNIEGNVSYIEWYSSNNSSVVSLEFSPDGSKLVSAHENGTIKLWDAYEIDASPEELIELPSMVWSVTYSANGEFLAASSENMIYLWRTGDLNEEPTVIAKANNMNAILSLDFSPNSQFLIAGSYRNVYMWDLLDLSKDPLVFVAHQEWVYSLSFSPDGSKIGTGSNDGFVKIWSLEEQNQPFLWFSNQQGYVRSVAFSPDGLVVAAGSSGGTVWLWNIPDFEDFSLTLNGHLGQVWSMDFADRNNVLVSSSLDGTIRIWDISSGQPQSTILTSGLKDTQVIAISPNKSYVATGSWNGVVRLWELSKNTAGTLILSDELFLINTLDFSPTESMLAVGNFDGNIYLWNLDNKGTNPIILQGHDDWVRALDFSSDGSIIASGSSDGTIRIWDILHPNSEPRLLALERDKVLSLSFSPDDNLLVAGSLRGKIYIWNLESDEITAEINGHDGKILSIAFSPLGKIIATGSSDGEIKLWNLNNLDEEPTVINNFGSINNLDFSPDGLFLASTDTRSSIRLWMLLDDLVEVGCQKVRRNLSWVEWQRYLPGEPYRQTCPNLPPHPSVPANELP